MQIGLLESLRDGPQSTNSLAARLDLSQESVRRLLRAAAALRLVEETEENHYALGPQGAAILGNAGLVEMIGPPPSFLC